MNKVNLTPAFLIHRRMYKNNSLLLDFFTEDFGKIRLIGRGIRQTKTNIQMFQNLNISFSGRTDLKSLSNWEANDKPRVLKGEALIFCIYINELISRLLLDNDPHPTVFTHYQNLIEQINTPNQAAQHWLLRIFESHLLAELGYGLDYATDTNNATIKAESHYQYQPQQGFCQYPEGEISGQLLNLLLNPNISQIPSTQQLKICRNINRARLQQLLGNKPLKSRSLFFIKESV